jgi:hypothetical protein
MLQLAGLRARLSRLAASAPPSSCASTSPLVDDLPFRDRHCHDLLGGGRRNLEAVAFNRADRRHAAVARAGCKQCRDTAGQAEAERTQSCSPMGYPPAL